MRDLVWLGLLICLGNACSASSADSPKSGSNGGTGGVSVVAAGSSPTSSLAGASRSESTALATSGTGSASPGTRSSVIAGATAISAGGIASGGAVTNSSPFGGHASTAGGKTMIGIGGLPGAGDSAKGGSGTAGVGTTKGGTLSFVGGAGMGSGGASLHRGGTTATVTTLNRGGTASSVGGTGGTFGSDLVECEGLLDKFRFTVPDANCSVSKTPAKLAQANVMLLLDKSGSMQQNAAGFAASKWQGVINALRGALNARDYLASYGLMLFPYLDANTAVTACELNPGAAAVNVTVGPAPASVPEILSRLMDPTSVPGGGTPTAAALNSALAYFMSESGQALNGRKYVVLITDGGPNCNSNIAPCGADHCTADLDKAGACGVTVTNCCDPSIASSGGLNPIILCLDDQAVLERIAQLGNYGVETVVVGIPGSEAYASYLDAFAVAGGLPVVGGAHKYYDVTAEQGLAEALLAITGSLGQSCAARLAEAPADPNQLNVAIDCAPIGRRSAAGVANWIYDAASNSVVFQGATCENIRSSGVTRIDVINGCPTVDVI